MSAALDASGTAARALVTYKLSLERANGLSLPRHDPSSSEGQE